MQATQISLRNLRRSTALHGRIRQLRERLEHCHPDIISCRIADDMPAGYVTLKGKFLPAHRDEILGLVNARGERARAKHPLQRIISVEHAGDAIVVTTTGVHVARGIAHALHAAFKGELKLRYSKDENLLRAEWKR